MDPTKILQDGVTTGIHLGAQLFVWRNGETILDFACGEARAGIPMQTDSVVQWFSTGKPLTAILIAQLYENGRLSMDDPVSRFIPEFAAHGKDSITIHHILTHTGGFRAADKISADAPWDEVLRETCETALEPDWTPGEKAGYSTGASWFILAEIVQRITQSQFDLYIKQTLLDPLGMSDTWLRLPLQKQREYGDRIGWIYNTALGKKEPLPLQDPSGMAACRPGATARGPIREIGRFYAMLLNGGELQGHRFLKPETVNLFTTRKRTGLYDQTFMHTLDFSLGFLVNSNRYGIDTVPYGYGRHASDPSYGHSGAQSSCAFADPEHNLIVAWITNGTPGERLHQKRQRDINTAVYEFFGLAT